MTSNPLDLPAEDATTAPWWAATRARRLVLQHCGSCGGVQHYPRALCTTCGGTDLSFTESSGSGVVHSATLVHRAPHPALETPYIIALIDLDEGPRLLTRIVDTDGNPGAAWVGDDDVLLLVGTPVQVDWWPLSDGRALPVFRTR